MKPLFQDLLLIDVADLNRMAPDGEYLVTPNDTALVDLNLSKASQKICAAFLAHPAKQLVCVVGGAEQEEAKAFELLRARKVRRQCCYKALSLPSLFTSLRQDDGRRFADLIEAIVESARDKATYEDHIDEKTTATSSREMGRWLKALGPEQIPADLSKFADWVREAFGQGLQHESEMQTYFKGRKRTDNEQKVERKKLKRGD